MKISIVTCSYQQAKYLAEAMDSVLSQGYSDLEYHVVDGGSTDGSVEMIQRYAERLTTWVSEPDQGQSDALNKGFRKCSGDIVGWLCSDDKLMPGALQAVADFFLKNPTVLFVYGDAIWIDADSRPIRAKREIGWNRFIFVHDHNYLPQPSCFWRREAFERIGMLQVDRHYSMDSDFWLRLATLGSPAHIPKVLSGMRLYPEQKSTAQRSKGHAEHLQLRYREFPRLAVLPIWLLKPIAKALRLVIKIVTMKYARRSF